MKSCVKQHTFHPSRSSGYSQPPQLKRIEIANLPGLVEIIETKDGPRFFMADASLKDSISDGRVIYVPARKILYPIPDEGIMEYLEEEDGVLFNAVRNFIFEHLDCPEETHYEILTAFVLHTYLIEKAEASPIVRFYGPKGSGKSRGGEILAQLCRRGVSTANLTGPGLFRVSELYQPTLVIDEIQVYGKRGDGDLRDLLNVRYRRGNYIIRINKDRGGLESIERFNAFGPTVLCGTEELPDTVKSRCITFSMQPNIRGIRRRIDSENARRLRNRLVAFHFRHFHTQLKEPKRIVKDGRLDEILLPLHQIVLLVRPQLEPEFITFAKSLEDSRREEDFESFDAEIVRALVECRHKVISGKVAVEDVSYIVNEGRGLYPLSQRAVGSVLTRLGLRTCRIAGTGKYARVWDEPKIRRLAERFDIKWPEE